MVLRSELDRYSITLLLQLIFLLKSVYNCDKTLTFTSADMNPSPQEENRPQSAMLISTSG